MTLCILIELLNTYKVQGLHQKAIPIITDILDQRRRPTVKDDCWTFLLISKLGEFYSIQNLYNKAEPLYQEAYEGLKRTLGYDNVETLNTLQNLVDIYIKQNLFNKAEPAARQLVEKTSKDDPSYETRSMILRYIKENIELTDSNQ